MKIHSLGVKFHLFSSELVFAPRESELFTILFTLREYKIRKPNDLFFSNISGREGTSQTCFQTRPTVARRVQGSQRTTGPGHHPKYQKVNFKSDKVGQCMWVIEVQKAHVQMVHFFRGGGGPAPL